MDHLVFPVITQINKEDKKDQKNTYCCIYLTAYIKALRLAYLGWGMFNDKTEYVRSQWVQLHSVYSFILFSWFLNFCHSLFLIKKWFFLEQLAVKKTTIKYKLKSFQEIFTISNKLWNQYDVPTFTDVFIKWKKIACKWSKNRKKIKGLVKPLETSV